MRVISGSSLFGYGHSETRNSFIIRAQSAWLQLTSTRPDDSSVAHGVLPFRQSARVSLYLLGVDLLLYMVDSIEGTVRHTSATWFGGLVTFLTFVACLLLFILFVRWFRLKLMWRLRNRLIVTYTFIGVIPVVLLLGMGSIMSYLFIGHSPLMWRAPTCKPNSEPGGRELAPGFKVALSLRSGRPLSAEMISMSQAQEDMFPKNELTVWYANHPYVLHTTVHDNGTKVTQASETTPVSSS